MNVLHLPIFREVTTALLVVGLLLQSATAVAPGPGWWGSQSVPDPDAFPDDFAAANVGQLKYLATKAAAALEAELPGGAGTAINALIALWNSPPASGVTRDDYLAVNQGQLKTVAALFYDRLGQPYPWAGSSTVRDDYQLVNLGQLKHVFSFALNSRTAGQGAVQIPTATLAAALAQWQALPVKPAGSSTNDFDGDGIPNLQEYLMGKPLFDPLDIDDDRILDSIEDAHPGVLSKLRFADAVEDSDGDGVMNFEEVLLGLNLASAITNGRADSLGDSEVLAWSLAAGTTLAPSTDAVRALWEVIDADWIDREAGSDFLYWLLDNLVDGVPAGLSAFRTDVANWAWQPWDPSVWHIENPPLAHNPNWEPVDIDGNGVADFDRDNDNLPDLWEYRYSLNLRNWLDSNEDPDGDQLPNWQEYEHGTNPRLADSDGDGFNDAVELWQGGDPLQQSSTPSLTLQEVGPSHQAIYTGQTTPALAVKVTQGGLPVAGVTVAFAINAGGGRLKPASSAVGTPSSNLSQTTASDGIAAVTYESAAGEPESTASVSAVVAGAAMTRTFTVSIVAIPLAYGSSNGGTGGGSGGSGGISGNLNSTKVPTPLRSTAWSASSTDAATKDGFWIQIKMKEGTQLFYPKINAFPHYLSRQLAPAALVGWQTGFAVDSWANHTRLEFEVLPSQPPPPKRPVVPSGARRYLVLVYQGKNVEPGTPDAPKYAGLLTFQYSEMGARVITLTGGIPETFIKKNGNESVTFEPPFATKESERVWISLLPFEGFKLRNETDYVKGWDSTRNEKSTSVRCFNDNKLVSLILPDDADRLGLEMEIKQKDNVISMKSQVVEASGIKYVINLDLHGETQGDADIVLKVKSTEQILETLHVDSFYIMEVKIGIYRVFDASNQQTIDQDGFNLSSDDQIIEQLNDVFRSQANVIFKIAPSSRQIDTSGFNLFEADGSLIMNSDGVSPNLLKLKNAVEAKLGSTMPVNQICLFLIKRLRNLADPATIGWSRGQFCYISQYEIPRLYQHEVGHILGLSTEMKGAQDSHDLGPWPTEMKPTLHEPNEAGLMYDGDLNKVTKWLRRADWRKANQTGEKYEDE